MNYITRLVGLPGERLRVFQGDLFARPLADAAAPFAILRKPPQKVVPLLQPVHDTAFEPAILHAAGWPLRWAATTPAGWQVAAETSKGRQNVSQRFSADAAAGAETAWLRYRHMVPEAVDWRLALDFHKSGSWSDAEKKTGLTQAQWLEHSRPELIADFNPYNARIERELIEAGMSWDLFNERGRDFWTRLGANWVGDLAVECDLASAEPHGSLVLDLVEAGIHYRAAFDLAKDRVELAAIDGRTGQPLDFHAEAPAKIAGGAHQLRFANVDDQLLLWIDDTIVDFDDSTYDADKFFPAGRDGSVPWKGPQGEDQGDLSPVGVGAVGAKVAVTRLAVLRDTYYIATDHREVAKDGGRGWLDSKYDYASPYRPANNPAGGALPAVDPPRDLFAVAENWPRFLTRRKVEFDIQNGQLFVMGDNSPESKDARLWAAGDRLSGFPGGSYVDRRLLIGKAICVFWPHSWGAVPGIPQLPGWPNFRDMRFVK